MRYLPGAGHLLRESGVARAEAAAVAGWGAVMMLGMVVTAPAGARPRGVALEAVLERVSYVNEETGYTIARVATDRSGADLVTVVGSLLGVQPGESLRLIGRWGSTHVTAGGSRCSRSPRFCPPRSRASSATSAPG
jgi:hypothetical protein